MLPKALSFVDVETTGTSPKYGKIIEIGIIRVENNKIVDQYSSVLNPGTHVDPFIFSLTGITPNEIENAPSFYAVKDRIKELLAESVFVAHNAIFDYAFLKKEFERIEESFSPKICCSVKLSRNLYPNFSHHNLDALIERFNFSCTNRHRAFDDAKVIWDFYQMSLKQFGTEKLAEAVNMVMKRPSLPIGISNEVLDALPENSGVYIFYSKENAPLYVGKSKNIRNRVLSHFSSSKKITVDLKISQNIARIETVETAGELGALLLEATLVKKLQPLYNRQLRFASKLLVLKKSVSLDNYNNVSVCNLGEIPIEEMNQVMGIFKSIKDVKVFLVTIAKEFGLCPKLLSLEKGSGNCFNYHLNLCKGACSNSEQYLKYNLRFDEAFYKRSLKARSKTSFSSFAYKTKIKDWPFKGPIAIKEKSQKEELFIIDKWCVLGNIKNESESMEDLSHDYLFDRDTYRILNRYLSTSKDIEIFNI